jgi:methylglutaconyl-CoA hydratase
MNNPLVLIEKLGKAATVLTLNRPDKRNALSIALMERICQSVEGVAKDPSQKILILKGAGPVFCAGLDLEEGSQSDKIEFSAQMVARTLKCVYGSPLVTIATVQGAAVAGGAGLMSACDLAVMAQNTKVGYPEVRRGLVAALVMSFLKRQLHERHVRELLFTGELISAQKALAMGLVNRVVAAESLEQEVEDLVHQIEQGGPDALRNTKKLIRELGSGSLEEDLDHALECHKECRQSPEAQEGINAFLEKRAPRWI